MAQSCGLRVMCMFMIAWNDFLSNLFRFLVWLCAAIAPRPNTAGTMCVRVFDTGWCTRWKRKTPHNIVVYAVTFSITSAQNKAICLSNVRVYKACVRLFYSLIYNTFGTVAFFRSLPVVGFSFLCQILICAAFCLPVCLLFRLMANSHETTHYMRIFV